MIRINIVLDDEVIELSIEEAKRLKNELDKMFDSEPKDSIPFVPYVPCVPEPNPWKDNSGKPYPEIWYTSL